MWPKALWRLCSEPFRRKPDPDPPVQDPRRGEATLDTFRVTGIDGKSETAFLLAWDRTASRLLNLNEAIELLGFEPAVWTRYVLELQPLGLVRVKITGTDQLHDPKAPIVKPEQL